MAEENEHPPIPLFAEGVAAGFPSPARGEIDGTLDLNELCVRHPAATYFIRARGESMIGAGIGDDDVLVVDRSITARNGDIIIAAVDGAFTVKRLEKNGKTVRLLPENPDFAPITLTPGMQADFFGVITYVVKRLKH